MSDPVYVPPRGIYFRLLSYHIQHVLSSRIHIEPQVFLSPVEEQCTDQLYTVVTADETSSEESQKHPGLFLLKNRETGYVLCTSANRSVGQLHDVSNDCWFRFEAGPEALKNRFRICCPSLNMVLVCNNDGGPLVGAYIPTGPQDSDLVDQYFSFLFEEMEIVQIQYDLDQARTSSTKPHVVMKQMASNNTSTTQQMTLEKDENETHTALWKYTSGFPLSAGTSLKALVPVIRETKFSVELVSNEMMKFSDPNFFTKSWKASFSVNVDAGQTVRVASTVTRGQVEVPYTMFLRSTIAHIEVETKGIWIGESTWDLRHSTSIVKD
ncbi:hemolytic lectin [Rhodocollybia butyracea]|uniref:Hemolytic lectin n=1 Tax=Rhodocollybia butyracea TaxID=206335 RepID=A0A9P5PUG2_9AGAR|nr:hemolytic lectin [Rhodocollybia butyracea]